RACSASAVWSCGAIGGALLAIWAWQTLPARAHHASTGRPAHRFVCLAQREGLPIAAFRGTWDAAGFYDGGPELLVIGETASPGVDEYLRAHPRAWIIARNYSH